MSLIERTLQASKLDNDLLLQNDRVGKQARKPLNFVKKPLNPIEDELLTEYKQQYPTKFEYQKEEINPVTGEVELVTKYRKFLIPEDKPELDLDNVGQLISQEEPQRITREMNNKINKLLHDKSNLEQERQSLIKQKKSVETAINAGRISQKQGNLQLQIVNNKITNVSLGLSRFDAEIQDASKLLEQQIYLIKEHNTKVTVQRQNNLAKINRYRDELNILNRGQFNTEKMANETEAEYLNRLERNAEIEVEEDNLENAKLLTIRKFREKMLEIIRDAVIIEQVANALDSLGEVDNKAILLKQWNLLKRLFIQTYGINNPIITSNDIIAFFLQFIHKGESGLSLAIEHNIGKASNLGVIQVERIPDMEMLKLKKGMKSPVFLKTIITSGSTSNLYRSSLTLLYSFSGDVRTFKEWIDETTTGLRKPLPDNRNKEKTIDEITANTSITKEDFNETFGSTNPSVIAKKITEKYQIQPLTPDSIGVRQESYTPVRGKKEYVEYGYGIHSEKIPETAHFGKVLIKPKKLYYHNTLVVKHANGSSVAGFNNAKVSEKYVKMIMNMLEHIPPSHEELNRLGNGERQLYDRLVLLAGLHKTLPHQKEKTINDFKKRLKLIEGEIEIGNNNPMLVKEIYSILHSLKDLGVITQKQIKEYMSQF